MVVNAFQACGKIVKYSLVSPDCYSSFTRLKRVTAWVLRQAGHYRVEQSVWLRGALEKHQVGRHRVEQSVQLRGVLEKCQAGRHGVEQSIQLGGALEKHPPS